MIIPAEQLSELREQHGEEVVVLTHGVYDILHPGHVRHLEIAKGLGSRLVVAVWSDACTAAKKGPDRPLNTAADRMEVVDALRAVDYTVEVREVGWPTQAIGPTLNALQPDIYIVSSRKHPVFDGAPRVEHASGRSTLVVHDITYGDKQHSTTALIAKMHDASGSVGL